MTDERGVMDVAAGASREALYAALQASQLVIVELLGELERVDLVSLAEAPARRALRIGACLGSDADLAAREAGDHTGHGAVAAALRKTAGVAADGKSITCGKCWRTSHHPTDVAEGYCGACKEWTTGPERPIVRDAIVQSGPHAGARVIVRGGE